MRERERELDAALLQAGKFNEALTAMLVWLSNTEQLMANLKPPSVDLVVVKSQAQEHKVQQLNVYSLQICHCQVILCHISASWYTELLTA